MADGKQEWKVLRRHEGDRMYEEGEIRVGTKAELGHLAPKTLEPLASRPTEKAEPGSPDNKAVAPSDNKAAVKRSAKAEKESKR